jgi:hypothetical protein
MAEPIVHRPTLPVRCRASQCVVASTVLVAIAVGAAALLAHPVLLVGAFVTLVLLVLD